MRQKDLIDLAEGRLSFKAFVTMKSNATFFKRMAAFYYRRGSWANPPLNEEDLQQIAHEALWMGVRKYRWRCTFCRRAFAARELFEAHARRHGVHCSLCPRVFDNAERFEDHAARRHTGSLRAVGLTATERPTLAKWAFGRVGSALDHEIARHSRRAKWWASPRLDEDGELHLPEQASAPRQESIVELSRLVEAARRDLSPTHQRVLAQIAHGERVAAADRQHASEIETFLTRVAV